MALLPLRAEDVTGVYGLWSDEEATRLTNWTFTETIEACAARLDRVITRYSNEPRHFGPFVIRTADDGFVGLIGADLATGTDDTFELWYFIDRRFWRRGFATAAVQALVDAMAKSGRARRIVADAVTSNAASWRLLEFQGFVRAGVRVGGHKKTGLDVYEYTRDL